MDLDAFRESFGSWMEKSQDYLIKSDWRSVSKDYPFLTAEEDQPVPYKQFNKKLKFCRVCLITGGALYLREKQKAFSVTNYEGDYSFRAIPKQIFPDDIEICHEYTNTRYARKDVNVLFPIERLRQLETEEIIGELAEQNYSIYDFVPQAARVSEELATPLVSSLLAEEIDVAIFFPVSELGHQTMALVQRQVEKAGITTVCLANNRRAASRMPAPRTFLVDCPDGAPLGEPGKAKAQDQLLGQLFNFVKESKTPGEVYESGFVWNDPFQ